MLEIMAPVGSYESLAAAINAGANSVYFGIEQLNMRARAANNFTTEDLKKIVSICKENNVKTYLTVNTIMYDHDLQLMRNICDTAKESGITAVICSDISAISYANSIGLEVHISTQTNVSNFEAVKFYSKFADVIVLARELTLKQIKHICEKVKEENLRGPKGNLIEIELFAHGALCVAISGKCYMSLATYNASANRGACLQNCRRSYKVIDEQTGDELRIDNKYIMSPKDLCTIGFIDKLVDAGATVFKIEGRGRSPDYVHTVIKCYREALDSYLEGTYTKDKTNAWTKRLEKVYNRGFWHGGYYLGKQLDVWSGVYGSQSKTKKRLVGFIDNYYQKPKVMAVQMEAGIIEKGDKILITGPTTGVVESEVEEIWIEKEVINKAKKGDLITIPISQTVRKKDKLFVVKERANA